VRPSRITGIALLSSCIVLSGAAAISAKDNPLTCRPDGLNQPFSEQSASQSFVLGQRFEYGQAGPVDPVRAYQWYCNSAMQGHNDAEFKVALMLLEGLGAKQDITTGVRWLNRSASKGNHDAELSLGILLEDTDAKSSARLFERAAKGGNLYANHRLAELYYYGLGVERDYSQALKLAEFGAESGFAKSQELITRIRLKLEAASENVNVANEVAALPVNTPEKPVEAKPSLSSDEPAVIENAPIVAPQTAAGDPPEKAAVITADSSLEEGQSVIDAPNEAMPNKVVTRIADNEPVIEQVEATDTESSKDQSTTTEPDQFEVAQNKVVPDKAVEHPVTKTKEGVESAPHVHLEQSDHEDSGLFSRMMSAFSSNEKLQESQVKQGDSVKPNEKTSGFKVISVEDIKAKKQDQPAPKTDVVSSEGLPVVATVDKAESKPVSRSTAPQANSIEEASHLDQSVVEIDDSVVLPNPTPHVDEPKKSLPQQASVHVATENAARFQRTAKWVNDQPNMRYAIQLVQASQPDGMMKFIEEHRIQEHAYFIHVAQDGQEKYVLLYGDYPNNRTSKAMAKTLPKAVQDNGYWIRTFGDLRRSYTIDP
jgi:septal ring-binding cell division protein DamX